MCKKHNDKYLWISPFYLITKNDETKENQFNGNNTSRNQQKYTDSYFEPTKQHGQIDGRDHSPTFP